MPIDIKQFAGIMDQDSPNEVIGQGFLTEVRNIDWRGKQPNLRPESVIGNRLLTNPLLPITGQNLTICRLYDAVRKRIYFFNHNSNGNHAIYFFDTISQTFQRVVENGVNTDGDALAFDTTPFLSNVGIIYGDNLQGDLLHWLNSQKLPCRVNVDKALNGGYGVIEKSFLDVAKEPFSIPPAVVYEDDPAITVNNVRKKLFKFKARPVFENNEKGVWSSQSIVAVPQMPFDQTIDADPTKNCRIAVVVQTYNRNVKKIEIAAAESLGIVFSDFYLVASLDKDDLGIPDNDIYTFLFYNDKAYNYINIEESIQLFDYVPQEANAQELLNGNVPVYGGIKEGYPNLSDFSTTNISTSYAPAGAGPYFGLFMVTQDGKRWDMDGNIHICVRGTVLPSYNYFILTSDATFTNVVNKSSTAEVIAQFALNLAALGFTIVSNDGVNNLIVSGFGNWIENFSLGGNDSFTNNSLPVYDCWSRVGFGLVYFDGKGRTNGAVTTDGLLVQSLPYQQTGSSYDVTAFILSIFHRPPEWAEYFQIVRSKDVSKSKILQWISDQTYKDTIALTSTNKFAYISLSSLDAFIAKNPATPLSYTFTPNDRIRFISRLNAGGVPIDFYVNKDFEIQGVEINPTINGVAFTGRFVKIFLPTTDATFDFGSGAYFYYFIELYTPAKAVENDLDLYYEFGEMYAIINPGTPTRYHQGGLTNQHPNLITPATFSLKKGDYYFRVRSIQLGSEYSYQIEPGYGPDADAGRITLGCTFLDVTVSDPNVLPGTSPFNNLLGFDIATDDTRWILKIVNGSYSFRIKGTITIIFDDNREDDEYTFFLRKNTGETITLQPGFNSSVAGTYSFTFDVPFSMSTGERIFIFGWSVPDFDHTRHFVMTNLTITRDLVFEQGIIDPNFSDFYPSSINSNGRAWITDPDADTVFYPSQFRWGLAYQPNTNINQTNRFSPQNFDEADRGKGAIMRFRFLDKTLRIFQERKCGWTGIYQRFISNAQGSLDLITTNEIVTKNNIQYYIGDYGIGNQPDSLVSDGFRDYFFDSIKSMICRLSLNGIDPISEIFSMQTFAGVMGSHYSQNSPYQFGGIARISGVLNVRKDNTVQYLSQYQSSSFGLIGQALAFEESKNGFTGFYDIDCEAMVCAENVLYSFREGQLYIHDNTISYAKFFDIQQRVSITIPFNNEIHLKKTFEALAYQSNRIWESPVDGDILTSNINPQTGLQQISQLISQDYEIEENIRYAALKRDANSMSDPALAINEGDYLKGVWIQVKLIYAGGQFAYLYLPYIKYIESPRNL